MTGVGSDIGQGELAVEVTRDGVTESFHRAHVVLARPDGSVTTVLGQADAITYPRSALKPIQTMAVLDMLTSRAIAVDQEHLAIISASHAGSDSHQIAVAAVLAEAGLDEDALQCPPTWPTDDHVRGQLTGPTRLSYNCSGKHAGMLWAHTATGGDPATYLDTDAPLQRSIHARLTTELAQTPLGPGIDGCGAPAWRCSLSGLATAFARLTDGADGVAMRVRDAMRANPYLIGGADLPDTALMLADERVVAKRGADGVMACGLAHPIHGPLGLAIKIVDGGDRAAGPLSAAVLHALDAVVPTELLHTPVLGGGRPHGHITALPGVVDALRDDLGIS